MAKPNKIILVDKDVVNCMRSKNMLAEKYEVFAITKACKLESMLENITPDLVLMDYDTLMDEGMENVLAGCSDARWRDNPSLFLFGEPTSEAFLEARSLGATGFASKDPALLKIWVDSLIEDICKHRQCLERIRLLQEQVRLKNAQVFELQNAVFTGMANIVELRDGRTGRHIERTKFYLEFLVNKLDQEGIYEDERSLWNQDTLVASATLHDIGKVAIPDAILFKPGKLTDAEFEVMKRHAAIGEVLIENMERNTSECPFLHHAKVIAATHHERWDGSGYPHGLKGEEIPLEGRLMAIADVYDAIISKRVYKERRDPAEAARIIVEGSGTHFDPILVEIFKEIAPLFADTAQRFSDYEDDEQWRSYSALTAGEAANTDVLSHTTTPLKQDLATTNERQLATV
ncbi:MAG: HD domain-containing protein [Coriobacteriales bacterium]|jgi:putative two-component system response regulator|nr:HD domain-containing protein [Coriobacteriales bacterium]